jgi:hypothetical protein
VAAVAGVETVVAAMVVEAQVVEAQVVEDFRPPPATP